MIVDLKWTKSKMIKSLWDISTHTKYIYVLYKARSNRFETHSLLSLELT